MANRPPPAGSVVRELVGVTMGTCWTVRCAALRTLDLGAVQRGIERRLQEVIDQMSTWEPSSLLCRYGRAPAGSWHVLPAEFLTVMRAALEVAEASSGAFDPAAAPIVDAWGFGPRTADAEEAPWPTDSQLDAEMPTCRWQRLQLDVGSSRLLQPGGSRLDLSAIAKGFAVDHVSRYLCKVGLHDHLVEIGGELRGSGIKPDAQPWWTLLEEPPGSAPPPQGEIVVALHGLSVATSGDYRKVRMRNGSRISHTVDPRTGQPVCNGVAQVAVVHAECMWADAWSTALGVLGPDEGMRLAESRQLAARWRMRTPGGELQERLSPAFARMLDA